MEVETTSPVPGARRGVARTALEDRRSSSGERVAADAARTGRCGTVRERPCGACAEFGFGRASSVVVSIGAHGESRRSPQCAADWSEGRGGFGERPAVASVVAWPGSLRATAMRPHECGEYGGFGFDRASAGAVSAGAQGESQKSPHYVKAGRCEGLGSGEHAVSTAVSAPMVRAHTAVVRSRERGACAGLGRATAVVASAGARGESRRSPQRAAGRCDSRGSGESAAVAAVVARPGSRRVTVVRPRERWACGGFGRAVAWAVPTGTQGESPESPHDVRADRRDSRGGSSERPAVTTIPAQAVRFCSARVWLHERGVCAGPGFGRASAVVVPAGLHGESRRPPQHAADRRDGCGSGERTAVAAFAAQTGLFRAASVPSRRAWGL